jgi:hypothetical protein
MDYGSNPWVKHMILKEKWYTFLFSLKPIFIMLILLLSHAYSSSFNQFTGGGWPAKGGGAAA